MGTADRKLRAFVAAPVLVIAGVLVGPTGWLAIVMLATAAVGSCPLYLPFGLRTSRVQATPSSERTSSR